MPQSDRQKESHPFLNRLLSLVSFLILVGVMYIGISLRLNNVNKYTYPGDEGLFRQWTDSINRDGLFFLYIYNEGANHPPVGIAALGLFTHIFRSGGGNMSIDNTPGQFAALKIAPILFDAAMIIAAYWITRRMAGPGWALITASAIALNPVIMLDSSMWGQTDSIFSFFLVLSLGALSLQRRKLAWAFFALAILSKLQAVAVLPLLVAATLVPVTTIATERIAWLRNMQSWRRLGVGVAIAALIFSIVMLPFIVVSGSAALRPYTQSVDRFPALTLTAYNFWWWVTDGHGSLDGNPPEQTTDAQFVFGLPISAKALGLLMFGALALLVMYHTLTRPYARNEYLLAGILFAGFFMLPTQIHERYIYPAIPILAMSMVRGYGKGWKRIDWRGVVLFIGFTATGAYNLYRFFPDEKDVHLMLGFLFPGHLPDVVRFNMILRVMAIVILAWPLRFKMPPRTQTTRPVAGLPLNAGNHG